MKTPLKSHIIVQFTLKLTYGGGCSDSGGCDGGARIESRRLTQEHVRYIVQVSGAGSTGQHLLPLLSAATADHFLLLQTLHWKRRNPEFIKLLEKSSRPSSPQSIQDLSYLNNNKL